LKRRLPEAPKAAENAKRLSAVTRAFAAVGITRLRLRTSRLALIPWRWFAEPLAQAGETKLFVDDALLTIQCVAPNAEFTIFLARPVPPSIMVWRSDRTGGDTKTLRSRRTLAMPLRCVEVLKAHRESQDQTKAKAGNDWQENDLVFCTRTGRPLTPTTSSATFARSSERQAWSPKTGLPRELRPTCVSLLSDSGAPLENISRLIGHKGAAVTELVYRHQIRPVIEEGAIAMDRIFPGE
jgi:hypothetical protein